MPHLKFIFKFIIFMSTLLLSTTSIFCDIIEINSDTPYSSGVVKFTDGIDIHFSTGLTLTNNILYDGNIHGFICNTDSSLYFSYYNDDNTLVNTQIESDTLINYTTDIDWGDVNAVDTTKTVLDYGASKYTSSIQGHYIYERIDGPYTSVDFNLSKGLQDIIISKDSSGNYIKWQIEKIALGFFQAELGGVEFIEAIHLRWEIDSLGNGKFPSNKTSNISEFEDKRTKASTKLTITPQTLTFPNFEEISIKLLKTNGQIIKQNYNNSNSLNISDISKGVYIALISSRDMINRIPIRIK